MRPDSDRGHRRPLPALAVLALLLLGCAGQDSAIAVEDPPCDGDGTREVMVLDALIFGRREGTVANGFDLDGRVSDASDALGCYKEDLVSPEGVPGIDSAFSNLMPALEATEAAAIEGLIDDSIHSGELLVTVELTDVDDPVQDACVGLSIGQALGPAALGADGELEAWWTWERDTSVPSASATAPMGNGRIDAGPLELSIPLQVLDASVELPLHAAWARVDRGDDGYARGFVAGGLAVGDVSDLALNVGTNVGELIVSLVSAAADLEPDDAGACQELSVVLEFTATPGFLFE